MTAFIAYCILLVVFIIFAMVLDIDFTDGLFVWIILSIAYFLLSMLIYAVTDESSAEETIDSIVEKVSEIGESKNNDSSDLKSPIIEETKPTKEIIKINDSFRLEWVNNNDGRTHMCVILEEDSNRKCYRISKPLNINFPKPKIYVSLTEYETVLNKKMEIRNYKEMIIGCINSNDCYNLTQYSR